MTGELGKAAILSGAVAVAAASAIQLAGCFPWRHRAVQLATPVASLAIALLMLGACILAMLAASAAIVAVSWPVAVISSGLGVLAGPLLFQLIPPQYRDTLRGILAILLAVVFSGSLLVIRLLGMNWT